jgi:hypothetical protein
MLLKKKPTVQRWFLFLTTKPKLPVIQILNISAFFSLNHQEFSMFKTLCPLSMWRGVAVSPKIGETVG